MNPVELKKTRDEILDTLIRRLKSWDNNPESGMEIVEKNQVDMEDLKSIVETLNENNLSQVDEVYREKIAFILEEQKKIIASLSSRQAEVKYIIKQLSKKDKIKDNYIKQNKESIFVDKDF